MYEDHFRLKPRPFGPCPDLSGLVRLPSRDAVLRRLQYTLDHQGGPTLLIGPSGVGKSVMAHSVGAESVARVVRLPYPALPALDLVDLIATELTPPSEFGLEVTRDRPGWGDSLRRLRGALASAVARGDRPLLIVEDAHLIQRSETWDALRLLLNFASRGESDLRLLLVGSPEILAEIPTALGDRLATRVSLHPLTMSETTEYVLGRLRIAGATAPLFDAAALTMLHQNAEGVPRRLDQLADLALLVAAAEGRTEVSPEHVRAASAESPFDLLLA